MSATERHAAMQELRLHLYWRDKHEQELRQAMVRANDVGVTQGRLATTLGVSKDTVRRRLRRIRAGASIQERWPDDATQ